MKNYTLAVMTCEGVEITTQHDTCAEIEAAFTRASVIVCENATVIDNKTGLVIYFNDYATGYELGALPVDTAVQNVLRAMMEDLFQGFPNKFDCAALVRLSLNPCVDSAIDDVQEHLYFMGCSQCTIAIYTGEMITVRSLV